VYFKGKSVSKNYKIDERIEQM